MVQVRRIAGVIFDWDGVLLDSLGASFNVYNKIFGRIGAGLLTRDEFMAVQSPNWYEFYVSVGLPKALWKEVDVDWMRLYEEERPRLHPDAKACLIALRPRFKLALVSNGSKARVERELRRFRLGSFFESVLCGVKREELKPSPVMLERTLRALGLGPLDAIYVGDAPADIQAAKRAGILSVAIARGPIEVKRLGKESPDLVFRGLADLASFLAKHA